MTAHAFAPISLVLNGRRTTLRAHPMARLLDVLREECGLTGTKEGCGEGECGACTVIVDGRAVNACLIPIGQVRGARVTTIEGLRGRHRLQAAFAEHGGAQCGICTPGMIMAAVALGPRPTLEQVRTGLAGNICRCTGYEGIYRSILAAQKTPARRDEAPPSARAGGGESGVGKTEVRRQKTDARSQKPVSRMPADAGPASPKPARQRRKGEGGRAR